MSAPGRYSIGFTFSADNEWAIAVALNKEPEYSALQRAMNRLRWMRWDDCDEERLAAIEARAFRLLATLRRLNDDIERAYAIETIVNPYFGGVTLGWVGAGRRWENPEASENNQTDVRFKERK